jgi:hypothetical protein
MANPDQTDQILALERTVLRAICCEFVPSTDERRKATRDSIREALRDLADYSWRGTEHVVVYSALAKLQASSGVAIADQLPAQATRMGFPDVDWKLYLQPGGAHQVGISELVRTLKAQTAKS